MAVSLRELDPGSASGVSAGSRAARQLRRTRRRRHTATSWRRRSSSSGCDGVTGRGGGGRRRASSPRPVPGSSRSGLAPPWELCVPTSVGLSLGRGKRPASRRQRPPLGIPVTPLSASCRTPVPSTLTTAGPGLLGAVQVTEKCWGSGSRVTPGLCPRALSLRPQGSCSVISGAGGGICGLRPQEEAVSAPVGDAASARGTAWRGLGVRGGVLTCPRRRAGSGRAHQSRGRQ